jgi:hypothetical protein
MPFNLSSMQLDSAKVRNGVVFTLAADAWVRLAPTFGPRFRNAWLEVTKPYRRTIDHMPRRRKREFRLRALALGCVLDWDGLVYTDGDGVEQAVGAYTPEKAYKIMQILPGFVQEVEERAGDWSNYK